MSIHLSRISSTSGTSTAHHTLRRAKQISALPAQGHWALMNKHKWSEAGEMGRNAGSIIETLKVDDLRRWT